MKAKRKFSNTLFLTLIFFSVFLSSISLAHTNVTSTSPTPPTTCEQAAEAFDAYSDFVAFNCDGTNMYVHSETGLPDLNPENPSHKAMVGIENWILRLPIPFNFEWEIPLHPQYLEGYEEAPARGPMAFAINGVPIFHLEARPDVSTDPAYYNPRTDTVLQGELDQCGGHAGQGEDYHYHYAPVCLLDDHDLTQPIAYGLDGVPVYFGTGGTDFYGNGLYNDINNLPVDELTPCNGYEQSDGSYVYFTTAEAPYTIGCFHADFDQSRQIEPRPMQGRNQRTAAPYGGFYGEPMQTLVTDFYTDEEGWMHMEHVAFTGTVSSSGISAMVFRASEQGEGCWDIDARADATIPGTITTYCR